LAVLVEAAVRNYVLQLRGIDSAQEFLTRHQQEMEDGQDQHRQNMKREF
jgi:HPr kinase/phosphorylase